MTGLANRHQIALISVTIFVFLSLPGLTGCSTAKSMTCESYANRTPRNRMSITEELIRDHDLDPYSNPFALAATTQQIDKFCGIDAASAYKEIKGTATKHLNDRIDHAVGWNNLKE